MRKAILGTLSALLLLAGILVVLNQDKLEAFFPIISSYYAKEFCSCLYVVGQPEKFCHDYVRQYVPISSIDIDAHQRRITVTGLFVTNSARFVSAKTGCVLENVD